MTDRQTDIRGQRESTLQIAEPEEGRVGDVVIDKLSPLHHVECVDVAGRVHVRDYTKPLKIQ